MTTEKVEEVKAETHVEPTVAKNATVQTTETKDYDTVIGDLKSQIDALVATNKAIAEEKRAEKEKLKQQVLNAETKTKEESDALIAQWKEEVRIRDERLAERDKKEQRAILDSKVKELADTATKDSRRAKSLSREIKDRVRMLDDGSLQVLDKNGQPTISTVEQLMAEMKNDFDYLFDGVQSTAGGTHSNVGTPGAKAFKDMNSDERTALYNKSPTQYEARKRAG